MPNDNKQPREESQRPDGSVQRLRADIDRGRTGDKVDWPDPAAAPLGTDDEAGGAPTAARTGAAVRQAESLRAGVPRQNRDGIGSAWVMIAVTIVIAAVVIGWFIF
jgi:hypothetical protein